MKKSTMQTIVAYLATQNSLPSDVADAADEIKAELNRGAEKAKANRELYESVRALVLSVIPQDTPVTVAEIYEAIERQLPEGFTKAKVQYALGHYWEADVVKHEGKVNSYTLA